MDLVLMGPPGVGKGTQAGALASWFGLAHLSSGDLLRENVREASPLGQRAWAFMRSGELVPDELVTDIVLDRMLAPGPGALLDGYPRTLSQARELALRLAEHGRAIDAVVLLTAPTETLIQRLSGRLTCGDCNTSFHETARPPLVVDVCDECGGPLRPRADDSERTVRNRLAVYQRQTAPLIGHYLERGLLVEVDADVEPAVVAERLVAALAERGLRSAIGEPR